MRQNEFIKIKKQFELEFGFSFLQETRKREYVEARACFIYYLYAFKKLGLVEITKLIEKEEGWKPNHATIHHSLKNYQLYSAYNPNIDKALRNVIGLFRNIKDKQLYISNAIQKLPATFVDRIHSEVEVEYQKFLEKEYEQLKN